MLSPSSKNLARSRYDRNAFFTILWKRLWSGFAFENGETD
jgi:hypothetical protein